MSTLQQERLATQFFSDIAAAFPPAQPVNSVVVTHLLSERGIFIDGVDRVAPVRGVIAKPRSIDPNVRSWLNHRYQVLSLSRRDVQREPEKALTELLDRTGGRQTILFDVGGYFTPFASLAGRTGRVVGIVEDTENGAQKYESVARTTGLSCPVISVARSPLKAPEDYLVGQSIVFSTEALLRDRGELIHGRTACVLGFGKLGRSIAAMLHARHLRVTVFDIDPVKGVEAMAHGFATAPSLHEALRGSEFVFCATGNRALKTGDFSVLQNGACVSTVTSPDDELELSGLRNTYRVIHESEFVTRYRMPGHEFYLLNRGQAVNFLHGAVVGPFIFLVQAEIVASVSHLTSGHLEPGLHENPRELRRRVAEIWYRRYGDSHFRERAMRTGDIAAVALRYAHQFPEDRAVVQELLELVAAGADLTSRKEFRGHVTCGAIVMTPDGKLLMIHHRSLDRWLFPGGHLEAGDTSLQRAALRELAEETGLAAETFTGFDELPVHIDCHSIPANPSKEEPEHRHWDFRYLFRATAEVPDLQTEEVISWDYVDPQRAPNTVVARLRVLKLL